MGGDSDTLKRQAAEYAVQFLSSGMIIGLGHGSTAIWAVRRIAEYLKEGILQDIWGIPCSTHITQEAERLGIPLTTLDNHPVVDVTIDGADEVTTDLNLIKGGGGALLREKIVAQASRREIIVVDETKVSSVLGSKWAVPVEVVPFGVQSQIRYLQDLGGRVTLRKALSGSPFVTDQSNYILDCDFGSIEYPAALASKLKTRAGIVEHGLFIGLATDVIIASSNGIRHLHQHKQ